MGIEDVKQLVVQEIFTSIQGESRFIGQPTTFVRLFGCNLHCRWCDEGYGEYYQEQFRNRPKKRMSIREIIHEVINSGCNNVCLTGGEPLLNEAVWFLILALSDMKYKVSIETNGSIPFRKMTFRRFTYVMDVKMPNSGEADKMCFDNLALLSDNDDVKFVIGSREDYDYMKSVLEEYPTRAQVHLSPVVEENGNNMGHQLAEWMLEDKLNARLTLQMHRYVGWGSLQYGVK